MKALSRDAAELIDAARKGEPKLTPASRAAARAKILARVGVAAAATGVAAGASSAAATTAAATPVATTLGLSLVAKIGISVFVVAGAVTGVVVATRTPVVERAPSVLETAPTSTARVEQPRREEPLPPAEARSASNEPEPIASARVASPAPSSRALAPSPAASVSTDPLSSENELIARAQRALASGQPNQALAALDEHARRFPTGLLAPEREAARVLALCAAGRTAEGRAAAAPFLKSDADSPIAQRIRSACGM